MISLLGGIFRWFILGTIMPSPLFLWQAGAVLGLLGVALSAFGAHGLQKRIIDQAKIRNWQSAANYQIMHSITLLVLSSVNNPKTGKPATLAGPATPVGGLIMLAGWGSLLL